MALTSEQRSALSIESNGFKYEGDKAQAVAALLQCDMTEYYRILNEAVHDPEALSLFPATTQTLLAHQEYQEQRGETVPLVEVPT